MSSKRAFEGINGPSCPCCLERLAFTGSKYQPAADNLADLCSTCVEIGDTEYDLPPFLWATTVAEIEASTASVLEAAEANLKAAWRPWVKANPQELPYHSSPIWKFSPR